MPIFCIDSPRGIKGVIGGEPDSSLLICMKLSLHQWRYFDALSFEISLHVLCICEAAFMDSLLFQLENLILPQHPMSACFLSKPKSLNPPKLGDLLIQLTGLSG